MGPFATFQLDFKVDQNGRLISGVAGPDLTIKGVLDSDNSGTKNGSETFQTLLEADVNGFGFNAAGGEIFEVTAAVTGGALANEFSPGGLGLILNAQNSGFNGLFTVDFANSMSSGISDTFGSTAVPEPSSWAVFGVVAVVGLGLSARRWRTRRKLEHAKTARGGAENQSQIAG